MNRIAHKILFTLLRPLRGLGLRRFSIVRKILGSLKENIAIVRGHTMYLDPADFAVSEEISKGDYESSEVSVVTKLIKPTDTILDLGANIGYFTMLFSDLASSGNVHAFEPSPRTFGFLQKNISANGMKNVVLHETAVGEHDGEADLYINEYNRGDNRVYPSFNAKGVRIRMSKVDSIIPSNTKVDMIKIDIQGFEVHALRGMERVLRENPALYMLVECWPKGLQKAGSSVEALFSVLESEGFSWCFIDDEKQALRRVEKEEIVKKFPADQDAYANLLCWKGKALPESIAVT